VRALPDLKMIQRILAPVAAVIGLLATAMATATIALVFTMPTERTIPVASGVIQPFFNVMLRMIADAVWAALRYL
jgi:hypothetical protein